MGKKFVCIYVFIIKVNSFVSITYLLFYVFSRLGQKGRSLKINNDNRPLFENKTAEADLGDSFQIHTPENLVNGFEKLDLVHDTPFVRPAVKTQHDSGIETPSDTLINLHKKNYVHSLNIKPNFSLSTKRSLYSNKENCPGQIQELKTPESQKFSQSNSSTSCSLTVKENVEDITNKLSASVKDDTCFVSPEISRFNNDTSLYHSIREITSVPDSSHSSFSIKNSDSVVDSSLSTKRLGCQPLDDNSKHNTLELSPAAKLNSYIIHARSPIRPTPVDFVQDGEFKRPITSTSSVCVKCANENYISVKGINYSILNTLGHGGSSIVFEVFMFVFY